MKLENKKIENSIYFTEKKGKIKIDINQIKNDFYKKLDELIEIYDNTKIGDKILKVKKEETNDIVYYHKYDY